MKKSKLFAPVLMLIAGAVVSIVMFGFHYNIKQSLPVLLAVLLVFYIAGRFIQWKVCSFMEQIIEEETKEGEVIEKEAPTEDGDNAKKNTEESLTERNA